MYGWYELGNVKKKTQDYYTGEIHQNGKKILEIKGNYMGYMDVGSQRYFDVREVNDYYYPVSYYLVLILSLFVDLTHGFLIT